MQMLLMVTSAAERKVNDYDDAFAPVPCPDCGQSEGVEVFKIRCSYRGTGLLETFVPRAAVEPAVTQALQLYDVLHARIDAACDEFDRVDGDPAESDDDNGASEREFSVKHDGS